jgi:glycosyltransferase involved in cell wall biosynthesis
LSDIPIDSHDSSRAGRTSSARHGRGRRPILVVSPQPFYSDRGTPIAIRQVLQALSDLGHEVDVLTFPVGRDIDIAGVRIIRCRNPLGIQSVPIGLSREKILLDVSLASAWRKLLRTRDYAYIHAVEEAAVLGIVFGLAGRVPVLYDMQSSIPERLASHPVLGLAPARSTLDWVERRLLRGAHLTVASWGLRDRLERVEPTARIEEWRYPQDFTPAPREDVAEVRRELEVSPADRLVLYCGTFEPYQGLSSLIDALPPVAQAVPDAVVALVGGDARRCSELSRHAHSLGMSNRVRILNRQPRARIPAFMTAADVLVSARASGENLPLKVFDYVAAGKPMVVTDIAGAGRLLGTNVAELVHTSSDAIARGLIRVLSNPGRAAELSRNARAFAERHLRWDRFVDSIAGRVERMTERASSGPRPGRA